MFFFDIVGILWNILKNENLFRLDVFKNLVDEVLYLCYNILVMGY